MQEGIEVQLERAAGPFHIGTATVSRTYASIVKHEWERDEHVYILHDDHTDLTM